VYFVVLASITDAALVMPTVAQALGLREIANRDPMEVLKDVLSASERATGTNHIGQPLRLNREGAPRPIYRVSF